MTRSMIGRFIFEGDPDNFIAVGKAVKWLQERPDSKEVMLSFGSGDNEVMVFAKRLKKSIRIRQVRP